MSDKEKKGGTDVLDRTDSKKKTEKPRKFKVILLNDDFTPMEFVIQLLQQVFHRSQAEATRITLSVHKTGTGVAGVYTREIAETKMVQTLGLAEQYGHPLQATIEPE